MAEFVEGFECMAEARPSVSIFGSARIPPEHPHYQLTQRDRRRDLQPLRAPRL
jgi:hypothetical protein